MSYMIKLILILLCFSIAQAGRIVNGDIWVDYANAGQMTQLAFSFMLENPIDQSDYIKISLPFPLHSQLTPAVPATQGLSSPSYLVVTYQLMDQYTQVSPTIYYAQILTETIDSSNYFLRFYATDRKTLIPIANGQWYYLKFKLENSDPLQYQKSNSILQIQISTVSSIQSNAIVYDDNLAFNYFQLSSTPPQSISLTSTPYNYGSAGGYLLTQASYSLYLDVNMNISNSYFTQNLVLKFLIDQQSTFAWNGSCSSVAKTNAPIINQLNSSLYTCQIDSINNIMIVLLTPSALTTQTSYRFTVGVINPAIVMKNVNIIVRAVRVTSGVIIGYGKASNALSTNQIYVTYQEIFVGWGLRPDALLPFNVRLFRGNSATPTYMPYNSLFTKFSISRTTASNVQLKIIINIPSQLTAYVLQNGYTFNLPAFPNKVVKCMSQYSTSPTQRSIGCTGIGSLATNTVYYIGWKMYFPYDNYESTIDCTSFGTITIYTTQKITNKDITFVLGRNNQFLTYLKSSPDYNVIGRNSSYITYMKTFLNLNLVVLSSDFQEFLKQPESILVTNRPQNYNNKVFNDVYVISQNLAFLTYISLFPDIYVALRLKSNSDIVKGYDTYPLVAKTTPKNTLTILTANSQDWTDFSVPNPLISSTSIMGSRVPTNGLNKVAGVNQNLVISWKGLYSSTTTSSSTPGTSLTNNWGLMIMMNPLIQANGAAVLTQASVSGLTVTSSTVNTASDYNKYTLITIKGSLSDHVQTLFPTLATKVTFAVQPFKIQTFSSIYANQNNFDIMVATVDGIDGPLNKITYNGFFLINGYTMLTAPLGTLYMNLMNYQSSTAMDGSKVPTLLRIKGSIVDTNVDSLAIFFDSLTPFYSNYYTGDIYCYSTDGTPFCTHIRGEQTSPSKQNYNSLSRFQIPLTTPGTTFNILIPVTNTAAQTLTNFYIGYQKVDPVTKLKSLQYIEPLRAISITSTAAITGQYGPKPVASAVVGSTITNLPLWAKYSTGVTTNDAAGNNIGAGFSYFSEWNYIGSATVTGWPSICYKLNYVYYYTNYAAYLLGTTFSSAYKNMNGIVCVADSAVTTSNLILTISSGILPAKWGKTMPGFGGYSQNTGALVDLAPNAFSITLSQTAVGIVPPIAGPSLVKAIGEWSFPLPVSLDANVKITISGGVTNIPYTPSGTCGVYIGTIKSKIGCIFTTVPTQLEYTLTINQQGLLPKNTTFKIVHYGHDSSAAAASNVVVSVTCYSLLNTNSPSTPDIIFSAATVTIPWQPALYLGATSLSLSSFTKVNLNKATVSSFKFSFTLISKGLYLTNRVRIDLGQLATDNSASTVSPTCYVLDYSLVGNQVYSHDWSSVDTSQGLNSLQLWPEKDIFGTNLTYTVKCLNFLTTSNPTPIAMTAKIANLSSDLTGDISSTLNIVPMQTIYTNNQSSQVTLTKAFTIPSSLMEMTFQIVSPGITVDSIMYLGFPSYYSNGLGPDIKCYTETQIYCTVLGRYLTIKYLGTYALGATFSLVVAGIIQPINYNSGTFYYLIDTDDNPLIVLSSGTFLDTVSSTVLVIQNFPTFPIYSMTQTSAYLRQQGVTLTFDFFLGTSLPSITVGQSLYLIFPPIYADILRFIAPTCTLNIKGNSLKNYINSCSILGLRLKMPFLDDIVLGSIYTLTVVGIINPTNPSANIYKYSLEISNSDLSSIIAKSYSPHGNFIMPIFIMNPNRLSLNYYTINSGLVNSIITMANLQSQQVYISPGSNLTGSIYQRNVYLSVLNNFYSVPSKINLNSGGNPFPIRMSYLTAGVNYIYFTKSGDGNYYSNLPPLTLIANKNYFTPLSFIESSFNFPINTVGSNYSLVVNLPTQLYPMSQVSFTVTLLSTVGLSLKSNPTIINFYPSKTSATIMLTINDATLWIPGASTIMSIIPSDFNTYAAGVNLTLNAVSAVSGTPSLGLSLSTAGLKNYSFLVTCSSFGKFFYHISRRFKYNLTACTLTNDQIISWNQQSSIDGLRVTQTYYQCLDILGTINIISQGVVQTLTITNLLASTDYVIDGFCQSQSGLNSNITSVDFTTYANGGYINKINFYFQSVLTATQKIKLSCALALYFKIDYKRVSTWDGYYCSQLLSRRLQTQKDDHSSKRSLQTATYLTQVYFGINNALNIDNSPSTINAQSLLNNLKNQLNNNVVGLPVLSSYSQAASTYIGSNALSGSPYIDAGPTYAYIKGLALTKDGLIYVIIGSKTTWTRAPLVSQIKQGSGPNGLPPLYYKVVPFRVSNTALINVAWTTMPAGNFTIYILPSDDNPFDTSNFGNLSSFDINSQIPLWQKRLQVLLTMLLVIIMIIN